MVELILMAALASAGSLPAFAVEVHRFDIPEEEAAAAIRDFGLQAHVQILVAGEAVNGKRLHAVTGELSTEDGLNALLAGSGLTHQYVGDRSVALLSLQATQAQFDGASADLSDRNGKKELPTPLHAAQVAESADGSQSKKSNDEDSEEKTTAKQAIPEILIRGSAIMNVDVTRTVDDAQPYHIFDSTMIEQSGAATVEEFLKQRLTMSSTFITSGQTYVSGVGATSAINLRGLGTNETLILIDGRRSAGVTLDGQSGQPDINGIPLAAIDRIEVLPSSASAIYGGAAVGGVVNIILKKDFQGGEVNGVYENTTSGSAPRRTVSATYGIALEEGKTRIMVSGQYSDAQPLRTQDRLDLVGRGISTILTNSPGFLYNAANPFQGATPNVASADGGNLTLKDGTPLNAPITSVPVGAAPGSNISAGLLSHAGTYNVSLAPGSGQYGLANTIVTTPVIKSLMATLRRDLSSNIEVFAEFSTLSNSSNARFNPFYGVFTVPSSAPTNPFQQDINVTFPSTLSGALTTDSVSQSATAGILGRLPGNWNAELDYTWSRNSFENSQAEYDYIDFPDALATGAVNPFVDTLAHPLNLAPFLTTQTFSGNSTLNDLGLRVSGPIGSLPWGQPTLTIGLEHRKEGSHDGRDYSAIPLSPSNNLDILNFGQSQSTNSLYAEAQIPLVTAHNAVPLIRSLDLQLAGRSEKYTVFAGTPLEYISPAYLQPFSPPQGAHATINYTSTNPTAGVKYRPVEDLILRASYSRAFLPPTASEFLPNSTSVCGGVPCTPITDPRNGQTYLIDYSQGGNPHLRPQTSRDWDLGAVWEPQEESLKGLRVDLEYYKITQPDYITIPSQQLLVSNPAYANRVTRDPVTGLITFVDDSYVNAEEYKTTGWDLTLDYRKATEVGTFGLHAMGTVVTRDQRQYTIGGPFLDYVGYPSEGGEGKTKANATLSWNVRAWTLAWTTTYFGSYQQHFSAGSPDAIQFGSFARFTDAQGGSTIPSQTYHAIYVSYALNEGSGGRSRISQRLLANLTIQVGIKNIFNTRPPFDAFFSPYFYSPYGDPRLRDFRISISKGL